MIKLFERKIETELLYQTWNDYIPFVTSVCIADC